jgi:hypothetical protein
VWVRQLLNASHGHHLPDEKILVVPSRSIA